MTKAAGAAILGGDESAIRSDYHSGATWAVKGKTPVVAATGACFKVNMLSAVSAKGTLHFKGLADPKERVTARLNLLQSTP